MVEADVAGLLKAVHVRNHHLLQRFRQADDEGAQELLVEARTEYALLAQVKQEIIDPVVERMGGEEAAVQSAANHRQVEAQMDGLEEVPFGSGAFDRKLDALIAAFEDAAATDEAHLLSCLERCPPDRLRRMAERIEHLYPELVAAVRGR